MKLKLLCISLLGLVAINANAESACQTTSRGYIFRSDSMNQGFAAQQAVAACQRHPSTSNSECERNIICSNVGYPGQQPGYPSYPQPGYPQPGYPSYPQPGYPQPGYPKPPKPGYPGYPGHQQPGYPSYPSYPQPAPQPSAGQCYLHRYPDICVNSPKNYCKDPVKHYREHGQQEGRIWGCQ